MIIKMTELKQSKIKEIEWRIDHGYITVPTHHTGNVKHIYKNNDEYVRTQTNDWITTIKKDLQNGKIQKLGDLLNYYIRRESEKIRTRKQVNI